MARILVTGMSGVGKTSVLEELARRGHRTVDTDDGEWNVRSGLWDEERMRQLLAGEENIVVSGTAENQGLFYERFAHVVLLSAPVEVLLERVRTRKNNPYGRTQQQQAEIRQYMNEVEPLLRQGCTQELDARLPLATLADTIEAHLLA